jgi:hypothetical protein
MKRALTFLLGFFYLIAFSQAKPVINSEVSLLKVNQNVLGDSADIYIARLTCNSAIVTTTYFEQLLLDSAGQRLVSLKVQNLDNKLLSYFDDTTKVLAIHIILTRKLEPNKNNFRVQYVYDKDYKQIVRVNYSYNNFNWYYLVVDNNPDCIFHIDKDQVEKAKLYWTEKIEP